MTEKFQFSFPRSSTRIEAKFLKNCNFLSAFFVVVIIIINSGWRALGGEAPPLARGTFQFSYSRSSRHICQQFKNLIVFFLLFAIFPSKRNELIKEKSFFSPRGWIIQDFYTVKEIDFIHFSLPSPTQSNDFRA